MKTGGEWRRSSVSLASALLLTQAQFTDDYDLRNLYFFDPNNRYLVPDPVYVPLLQASASTLTSRLVGYLKTPPKDWLAEGATQTAFPPATKVTDHALADGLATVNVTGTITKAQEGPGGVHSCYGRWSARGQGELPGVKSVTAVRERQAVLSRPARRGQPGAEPVSGQATGLPPASARPLSARLVYYLDGAGDVYSDRVGVARREAEASRR